MNLKSLLTTQRILSAIFFICGIIVLWSLMDGLRSPYFSLSALLLLVVGLVGMLVKFRPNTAAAMFCFFFSLANMTYYAGTMMDPETILLAYVICFTMFILCTVCLISSIYLYIGYYNNILRLKLFLIIILAALVLGVAYVIHELTFVGMVSDPECRTYMITMLCAACCLIMLSDKRIKRITPDRRIATSVSTLSKTYITDKDAYIERGALKNVLDDSLWTETEGIFCKETKIPIHTNGTKISMILRKRRDDDAIHISIVQDPDGTYFYNLNFFMNGIDIPNSIESCNKVTFYGNDGLYIKLLVIDSFVDSEKDSKAKKFVRILLGNERKDIERQIRLAKESED